MDQLDNAVNNVGHDPHNQLVNVLGVRRFERLATNRPVMTRILDGAFFSIVILWINLVGINNMMRLFTNHSHVIRLTEHGFTESVTPFLEIVGEDNFVRLMTNSYFVSRILNAEFNALMRFWLAILGPEVFVRLASNRRVVARLGNPFMILPKAVSKLSWMKNLLEGQHCREFVRTSVANSACGTIC